MKPATPLPWGQGTKRPGRIFSVNQSRNVAQTTLPQDEGTESDDEIRNAAYIVHACNAYPRLIETLRTHVSVFGAKAADEEDSPRIASMRALLRELGEI